jgi:hypothetical protein
MIRFPKLIVFLVFLLSAFAQSQSPISVERSSDVPQNAVPQNAPCVDQPRSLAELATSFRHGKLPLVSQRTGTWVEIGDVSDDASENSLNCSGIRRDSKFEFVLVANRYSVELHAIGVNIPQRVTMEPDRNGSIEFREVDFGGEGTLDNYRCRITNRGTLACLLGQYNGVEFKKMAVVTQMP